MQNRPFGFVSEGHMPKLDIHTRACFQRNRIGRVFDLGGHIQECKHALQVGRALLDFAIEHAQKIQGHVELDHESIDHDQITQSHNS